MPSSSTCGVIWHRRQRANEVSTLHFTRRAFFSTMKNCSCSQFDPSLVFNLKCSTRCYIHRWKVSVMSRKSSKGISELFSTMNESIKYEELIEGWKFEDFCPSLKNVLPNSSITDFLCDVEFREGMLLTFFHLIYKHDMKEDFQFIFIDS